MLRFRRTLSIAALVSVSVASCGGTGAWLSTPDDGLSPRSDPAYACLPESGMFVWGGGLPSNRGLRTVFDDGAVLTPTGWSEISPNPLSGRVRAGAAYVDGFVLVWGGAGRVTVASGPSGFDSPTDGALYSIEDDQWELTPPAPLDPRSVPEMEVVGRQVYVFGGDAVPGTPGMTVDDAALFDLDSGDWLTAPVPPDRTVVVGMDDQLFAFGGEERYRYEPGADAWVKEQYAGPRVDNGLVFATDSGSGTALLFGSYETLEYDPITGEYAHLGSQPPASITSAIRTAHGVVAWSDSDTKLVALHSGEADWIEIELPGVVGVREGSASCLSKHQFVIWGGLWRTSDGFPIALDTGIGATLSDLVPGD